MTIIAEYDRYDALGLAALVKAKEVSAAELLETAIARAEAVNPRRSCGGVLSGTCRAPGKVVRGPETAEAKTTLTFAARSARRVTRACQRTTRGQGDAKDAPEGKRRKS